MISKLNDDLLVMIFEKMVFIKEKRNLLVINKRNYQLLITVFEKYKLIYYLNNDYPKFYTLIKTVDYFSYNHFLDQVLAKAFMNIPIINASKVCSMYDLRFIFELMFHGYGLESKKIKNIAIPHFYIHFYNTILRCLTDDRKTTIKNIRKSKYLFSLQKNPKFCESIRSKKNFIWHSIIE